VSLRVGVLVSGEGSNLQAILDQVHGQEGIEVVGVASSKEGARGLERARGAGVDATTFEIDAFPDRDVRDAALGDWLEERQVELVVLAGFMQILGPAFIRRFAGRIVNVHPSLLPSFPGLRPIEEALEHGVKITGVTVHFVDESVDSGPIILQEPLELPYSRDRGEVEQRLHAIEHRLLPETVRLIAAGRVRLDPHNPRVVRIEDDPGG
jgi:phosphoribosylglycinamide formyltransferase-1